MPLEIKQRETEGIIVLDLKGRLVLGPDDLAFRQALESLLAAGKKNVILNLHDLFAVDTAGVGSMIFAAQKLREAGGRLVLLNIVPSHTSLDDLLKLDTTFDTYSEELAAVNSFFPDRALPRYDLLEFLEEEREHREPPQPENEPA